MKHYSIIGPPRSVLLLAGVLSVMILCGWGAMKGWISIGPTPAEHDIGQKLGIEPTLEAIEAYLDDHLAVGRSSTQAFAIFDLIEGESLTTTPVVGNIYDQDAQCYIVEFHPIFHTRTLDRLFCVDQYGTIIWVASMLAME